ncbi:serine protease FAM111A-like isoform X2 [Hyperolius riggenbachi]|uniref:serine protease FAM111A-like isoform X2 n=1 Tax=Hyperolius riggenbachi TaxID=752182 RepID=UPI0035A3929A
MNETSTPKPRNESQTQRGGKRTRKGKHTGATSLLSGQTEITRFLTPKKEQSQENSTTNQGQATPTKEVNKDAKAKKGTDTEKKPASTSKSGNRGAKRQKGTDTKQGQASPPGQENRGERSPSDKTDTEQELSAECKTKPTILLHYIYNEKEVKDKAEVNESIGTFLMNSNKTFKDSDCIVIFSRKLKAIINPNVPCGALVKKEVLEINKKRAVRNSKSKIPSRIPSKYPTYEGGVFFNVRCKGSTSGGGTRKILSDPKYEWKEKPLAVFGYKDQTIKEAVQKDERFSIADEFRLEEADTSSNKSSTLLSDLGTEVYTIVLESESRMKSNQSEPTNTGNNVSQQVPGTSSAVSSSPSTSQTEVQADSAVLNTTTSKPLPEIYRSTTSNTFSNELQTFAKKVGKKELKSNMIKGFESNVLYKKPMLADTFRLLNQHRESVALIRYPFEKKNVTGTLFLISQNLGLTCCHVFEHLIKSKFDFKKSCIPNCEITFQYEKEPYEKLPSVARVICYDEENDFAFVSLTCPPSLKGLLEYVAHPPQEGAVSIIGHPDGLCKKIDPMCSVVNFHKRGEAILHNILTDKCYIQVLTKDNFAIMSSQQVTTYDTCLYWGASGSPVFDDRGNLVAMHTGGYPAETSLQKKSVIEYGRNILDILVFGAIRIEMFRVTFKDVLQRNGDLANYMKPGGHEPKMQPHVRELKGLLGFTEIEAEEPMETQQSSEIQQGLFSTVSGVPVGLTETSEV